MQFLSALQELLRWFGVFVEGEIKEAFVGGVIVCVLGVRWASGRQQDQALREYAGSAL